MSQSVEVQGRENTLRHLAIILDGNGRWAKERGLERSEGHQAGFQAISPIVRACSDRGIEVLSVFAFSTENWSRPKDEVDTLMHILKEVITTHLPLCAEHDIQLRFLGDQSRLPLFLRTALQFAEKQTANNHGMFFDVAINYGARDELLMATRAIANRVASGELQAQDITQEDLQNALYTKGQPPVDLLIRTGGDNRISNFLLYQAAYAEFSFIKEYWPDFTEATLEREIAIFQGKKRRFGGLDT